MSISSIARADALFQEQVHRQWRDWHMFLSCQLTLLDAQADEAHVVFEQAESREASIVDAQRQLAALPLAQRTLFENICEERRQQLQQEREASVNQSSQIVLPEALERQALLVLRAEAEATAEGEQRNPGWGDVPLQVNGAVHWYRVNVAALREAPAAAIYAAASSDHDDMRRRWMFAGLLSTALILFLLAWFLWPRGGATITSSGTKAATANGAIAEVWPIETLVVKRGNEDTPINITAIKGQQWEKSEPQTGQWQIDSFAPLRLCISSGDLVNATTIRIEGKGFHPDRIYTLAQTEAQGVDLLVVACDTPANQRFGSLQPAQPVIDEALNTQITIDEQTVISVEAVTVDGPAQEPSIPAEYARVNVRIVGAPLDWPTYAPTLLLADGTRVQTPDQHIFEHGSVLAYFIPLPRMPTEVVWSVVSPVSKTQHRWRASLAPPPSHADVLADSLLVQDITPQWNELEQTVMLSIQITNRGSA